MVSLSSKSIGSDMASVSQGLSLNDFRRNTKINECIEATKPTLPPKRPTVRFQLSDPTEEPTIKNDKVFKTSDYDEAQTVDNDDDQFEHTRKRLAGQTPFEKNIHHEISHAQGISTSTPSHRDPLFEYDYACDISPVVVPPLTDIKSTATSYMTSNGNSVSSGAPTPLTNVTNVYKSAFVVSRSNNSHSVKLFDYENSPSFVNPNPFASTVLTSSSTVPAKPAVSQPKSNKINSISNIKKRPPQSIVSYADTTFTPDTRSQMTHREEPLQGRELVDMLAAYWSPETPAPGLAHSFLNRLSSSLEYSHCQDESLISLQSQQSYPPVPLSNQVTQASPAPFVVATPDSTAVDSDAKLTESDQSSDLVDDSTSLRTSNLRSVESEVTFEQIGESMDSITSSAQFSENVEANVESPDPDVVKVVNREESAKIVNKSNANSNVNTFISATSEYFQSAADTETKVATITRDKYASSTVVPVVSSNTSSQQQQHYHDELEENGVSLTKPTIGKRRAQLPPVEPTPDTFDILGSVPMIFPQKEGSTLGTMEPPVLEMVSFAPANVALSMTQKQQQMQLVEAHSNNNSTGELRIVTTSVISLGKTMQPPTESMFVLAGDATTSFVSEDNDHDSDNDKNHLDLDTPEEGMESLEAVMATLSVSNHVLDSHTSPQQVMTNIRSTVVVKPQSDFSCLDFERTPTMVRIPPLPYSVYVKRAGLVTPLLRKFGGPVRLTMSQNKHSATRSVNPTAFTIADNSFRSDDSTAELFQQDNHSFVTNLYDQKLPVTPSSISVEYQHHGLPSAAQFSQRDGIVSEDRSQMSLDKFFASFKSSITGCEFVPVKPETHWKVPLTTIYPIQESVTERCGSDEREDTKKWIGVEDEDEDRLATDYGNFVVDKNNNDTSVTNNHYDNVSPVHAVDDSGIFTAATTMTLDLDESYAQHGHSVGAPRLALVSKCSNSSKAMDMKEIILTTNINATASSSLCFCNKRKVTMKFHSKTIMIRFEPTDRTIINPGEETQFEDVENVFSVNQKLALIKPNGELQLTVSLKPVLDVPGIYSGVLKLTTNGKVILLSYVHNLSYHSYHL